MLIADISSLLSTEHRAPSATPPAGACAATASRCTARRCTQTLAATRPMTHTKIMPTIRTQPSSLKGFSLIRQLARMMAVGQTIGSSTMTSTLARRDSRRLVVELRDMPVELISKRLAKALLAPRLRPVAHIHRAAQSRAAAAPTIGMAKSQPVSTSSSRDRS